MLAEYGFESVKQLRVRDFVYNGVKIYEKAVPEDYYLTLVVKYMQN